MTSRAGFIQLTDTLFRTLTDSTSAAIFLIARDRFQYVNPAMAALVGSSIDEVLATDPFDLVHPDSLPEALRRLGSIRPGVHAAAQQWEIRLWTRRRDSVWLALATTVIDSGSDPIVAGVGVDITGEKLRDSRADATSDAEISQFARGVAHDLNDLLQVIQGHADRLSEGFDASHPLSSSAEAIRDAASRAAGLTHDLLDFSHRVRTHADAPPPTPRSMRQVILLVEDEESVRALIGDMLERHGYEVVQAASGEEGLRLEQERQIDLLLSDVMLPGRNGFEVASLIRQRSPHVRVIFMSGFTGDATPSGAGLDPHVPLIHKPFKMSELIARVREVLG